MARGKNYRQAIIAAVGEMDAWDKEVYLDALAMDTGIEPHKITTSISTMRKAGWPVDVVRREGRKILSWKFRDQAKWTDRVAARAKEQSDASVGILSRQETMSRPEAFKKGYSVDEVNSMGLKDPKGYTSEDMERGRVVLMNYNSLPQKVKDQIGALKKVLPQPERGELEQVLVDLLGAKPVQDSDPSFWAVDEFADGSLMLTRKDGTHWKATKL